MSLNFDLHKNLVSALRLLGILFVLLPHSGMAQEFQHIEDEILKINQIPLRKDTTDEAKFKAAQEIQDILLQTLVEPESWDYSFESLRYSTIAIAEHPKADVRLFTYNVISNDGKFTHYGVLQHKKRRKKINVYPLWDSAQALPENYQEAGLTNDQWIGALYYQMVPFKHNRNTVYMLMGFDGHNIHSNRSILDALYFEDGEPLWGYELYRSSEEDPTPEPREVFEYHKSAQLLLRYQEQGQHIVIENLSPSEPKYEGNPYYYIPSGDYYAYFQEGKTWVKKLLTDDLPFAPKVKVDVDEIKKDIPR